MEKVDKEKMLKPIFIISPSGRSGTTLLAERLSESNKIVCDEDYPYENFIANYYIKLSKIISLNGKFDIYPKYGAANLLIGPYPDKLENEKKNILFEKLILNSKSCIRKLIDDYYYEYAITQNKNNVTYFVEKFGHFLLDDARKVYQEDMKVLVMIRNPLEIYDSIKKFNLKRGFKSFGMENYETDLEYLVESFLPQQKSFYDNHKLFNGNAYIVEYNRLINSTENELKHINNYLSLNNHFTVDKRKENSLHKTSEMTSLITNREKEFIINELGSFSILKQLFGADLCAE